MRDVLICLVTILMLAAGCCPVTSVNPLSPMPDETYDRRLAGIWQLDTTEDRVFVHLGRTAEEGGWQVVIVEHKPDGTMEQESIGIITSAIGTDHYLTLNLEKVSRRNGEGQSGHIILKYQMPDSYTLILERMNLDVVATAIRGGHLAGEVQYDQTTVLSTDSAAGQDESKVDCARITDSSAALAEFIAGKSAHPLFIPHLTFKRVPCIPLK